MADGVMTIDQVERAAVRRTNGGSEPSGEDADAPVARVYWRNDILVVWCFPTVDAPVFAACRTPAGRWSIVALGCRDLSGTDWRAQDWRV
jgi:hypothetical protein